MNPDVAYARNGKVAIAYEVVGDGPVDLVYLPGFINNLELVWDNPLLSKFLERLSSFCRLIMIDRRGAGLSDRMSPDELPPLEDLVDDVNAVLDRVGSERAALLGYSDCGRTLRHVCRDTHPDRTSALILYATAACESLESDYKLTWTDAEWETYLARMRTGWGSMGYARESLSFFDPSLAGDEQMSAWYASFQRLAASPTSAEAIERICHEMDIRAILPTIGVPTLVLHREGDSIESVEAGRDVAARIPGARFVAFPGVDHHMWAGDQDALLDEIERFLASSRDEEVEFDRVLATVLFTDIVDSTATAAAMGDRAWRDVVERASRGRARTPRPVSRRGDGHGRRRILRNVRRTRSRGPMRRTHHRGRGASSASRCAQVCTPARSRGSMARPVVSAWSSEHAWARWPARRRCLSPRRSRTHRWVWPQVRGSRRA